MTVIYGYVKGSDDGWNFYGKFGPKVGRPTFAIEGGLNEPIKKLSVPDAELVNAKVGSFEYEGNIGPRFLNLRSITVDDVIILGKLGTSLEPKHVRGWLQIKEIIYE